MKLAATSQWKRREHRARLLAERYPASHEILEFYAALADWQGLTAVRVSSFEDLQEVLPSLIELVHRKGPRALAEQARALDAARFNQIVREYWNSPGPLSTLDFFARAALQLYAANLPAGLDCAWCERPPQVGCLSPQGEGLLLEVVCPLCLRRRNFPRARCPGCYETSESKRANFTTTDFPHLRLVACETCRAYLFIVDLSRDRDAIPEVDELAGLPLDLWAIEQGYRKLQPNLAGV